MVKTWFNVGHVEDKDSNIKMTFEKTEVYFYEKRNRPWLVSLFALNNENEDL